MNSHHPTEEAPHWQELIRQKVEALRFGVVVVTVHDGKVTQIETTERTRIESNAPRKSRLSVPPPTSP